MLKYTLFTKNRRPITKTFKKMVEKWIPITKKHTFYVVSTDNENREKIHQKSKNRYTPTLQDKIQHSFVGEKMNIKTLKRLFINRTDCYAVQDDSARWRTVHESLVPGHVHAHLDGEITIGVHQISTLGKLKWVCYDFDGKHFTDSEDPHPKETILIIKDKLKSWYNLDSYIEKSGSKNSYHLWIFINPVDKQIALDFNYRFREELKLIGINNTQVEKGVHGGTYGCMIRLPLGINRKNMNRSTFFRDVNLERIEPQDLPVLDSPYKTQSCVVTYDNEIDISKCIEILKLYPYLYSKYIATHVNDRSAADFVIAKCLVENQVHPDIILQCLLSTKWSKVHQRGKRYFDMTYERALTEWYRI